MTVCSVLLLLLCLNSDLPLSHKVRIVTLRASLIFSTTQWDKVQVQFNMFLRDNRNNRALWQTTNQLSKVTFSSSHERKTVKLTGGLLDINTDSNRRTCLTLLPGLVCLLLQSQRGENRENPTGGFSPHQYSDNWGFSEVPAKSQLALTFLHKLVLNGFFGKPTLLYVFVLESRVGNWPIYETHTHTHTEGKREVKL